MVAASRYRPQDADEWNRFIAASKNGTFLFHRQYMEYHADRFRDHSLLFRDESRLLAVMPASQDGQTLVSHGGLTYGGIISGSQMKAAAMLETFDALIAYGRTHGLTKLIYKRVPYIYYRLPADEDLYALFRANATLLRRDLASTLEMAHRTPYTKGRQYCVNKSRKAGLTIARSDDFAGFMSMEADHLGAKYGVKPVHATEEMTLLARRFPENIRLFTATRGERLLAGIIIYESTQVAHAQYIGSTAEGREASALDAVIDHLLTQVYAGKRYFDFGISTEQEGRALNAGLLENKESYGARGVSYDFYELRID